MAAQVKEILDIPDGAADDDSEIYLLYAIKVPVKRGTTKSDPITVEGHVRKAKKVIDLSKNSVYFDADLELLQSWPDTRKVVYKGESSNSTLHQTAIPTLNLTFMCEICADDKPTNDLFTKLGCNHAYCSECIAKYIASRLQDNITTITCPVSGCYGQLEPEQCRSVLPKNVFDRWGDALCEALILGTEKLYCPYKNCSAMLIDDRNKNGDCEIIKESECPYCNRLFCAQCKVPWHHGIVCSEFRKLRENERSNEDILLMNLAKNQKWMRCTKCGFFVEKIDGCLFMKCRCGYTFCYFCGNPLTEHYCRKCKR